MKIINDVYNLMKNNGTILDVQEVGEYILIGSMEKGETIYKVKKEVSEELIEELIEEYKLCLEKEKINSASSLRNMIYILSGVKKYAINIYKNIMNSEKPIDYYYINIREVKMELLKEVGIKNEKELKIIIEEFIKEIIKESNKKGDIIILERKYVDEMKILTVSNYTYKLEEFYNEERKIGILNLKLSHKMEKENPTDLNRINIKEVDQMFPDWEDEDNEEFNYNKFILKMENDLVDYEEMGTKELFEKIMENAYESIEGYDNIYRYKAYLKNMEREFNKRLDQLI